MFEDHEQQPYIAQTGAAAKDRLTIQHEVFLPGTKKTLELANFNPDMNILIVGCGCGDETAFIAAKLSDAGRITAIDVSEAQIKVAAEKVSTLPNKANISFVAQNILEDNPVMHSKFDMIFCRFVIPHLLQPKQSIEIMQSYLKPGGVLASQELIVSRCWSEPKSDALARYIGLMGEWAKSMQRDFDMAATLPDLFLASGLQNINSERWQAEVKDKDHKIMVTMSADECAPAIIKAGLISTPDMQSLVKNMKTEVVDAEDTTLYQCENILTLGFRPK